MCSCNKGLPANKSPIISGAFAVSNGNFRYSNNDFIVKYYIGETGNYIGSATGIDYGIRTYNTKSMVHASDYEADSNFFSDTEVSPQEEVNVVMVFDSLPNTDDLVVENLSEELSEEPVVARAKTTRNKTKKETEIENTL